MITNVFRFFLFAGGVLALRHAAAQSLPLQRIQTSPAPSLGVLRSLAVGAADRVYVGEEGPARILTYDSAGSFLRSIGREGSGPGELRSPVVGAGSFVIAYDGQLRRITAFDPTGNLLWTKPGPCCRSRTIRIDRKGQFYVLTAPLIIGPSPETERVNVYSAQGTLIDSLTVPASQPDSRGLWQLFGSQAAASIPIPFAPRSYHAVTRSGGLVWGTSSSPVLFAGRRIATPAVRAGLLPGIIRLTTEVRQAAREAAISEFSRFFARPTLERTFRLDDIPETAPTFFGLDVDSCDRWWVLRTPPFALGATRFDILSPAGQFIAQVTIAERLLEPSFLWATGDHRLAAIVDDGAGAPQLALYRLPASLSCRH